MLTLFVGLCCGGFINSISVVVVVVVVVVAAAAVAVRSRV
jgi:hypothetical protein